MVLFFYGPNTYASRQKLRQLVERFKKSNGSDFGLERLDGETATAEQLISAMTSLPFLGANRLVIIEDILANKQLTEAVLSNLERVPETNVVVFYERQPDERTKAFKTLRDATKSKKFEPLELDKLQVWLRTTAEELGGELDHTTAIYLVQRAGTDQWKLAEELRKLINFNAQISKETINQLVEPIFEQTIFDLIEALSRKDALQALKLYKGLRQNKTEPLYVLSMIGWHLHNLLVVRAAQPRPNSEIAKTMGISPFVVNKAAHIAKNFDTAALKKAYGRLVETDTKLKTSAGEPDFLMEQLIIKLAQN